MTDEALANELAALRAEMTRLRRDLDDALERLDMRSSRSPFDEVPEFPRMEFEQVAVRHGRMQIPVIIHSGQEESGVSLYDGSPRMRGWFGMDAQGRARLEILNAEGKLAVTVGEGPGGRGEIIVNDADGTPRAGLKAIETGGVLSVVDARGRPLAAMAGDAGGGTVWVCTPQQKAVVALKSAPEGGMIVLAEPSGQTMGSFTVSSVGAALTVYGEQGVPAATLSGLGEWGGQLVFCTAGGELVLTLPGMPPED